MPVIRKNNMPVKEEHKNAPVRNGGKLFDNFENDDIILIIVFIMLVTNNCDDKLLLIALGLVFLDII